MRFAISACMFLVFARSTYAAQCAAPPLNLPIRSLSVAPGTISRGIPISIGTPPQQLVLTPSLQLDNTFIPRFTNSCIYTGNDTTSLNDTCSDGQDARETCAALYGGGFDPILSTTFFNNGTNSPVSEAWFKDIQFSDWHFMTDTFRFADYIEAYVQQNKALPEKRNATTSFVLPDEGATFGGLGSSPLSLTPDSRLLGSLYAEEMVPSKSWSLTDENLCLGCIDTKAYTGEFQNFKPADRFTKNGLPCLLQAKVERVDYYPEAASAGVGLLDSSYDACIDPGVPFLVFPADAREKLPGVLGVGVNMTLESSATIEGLPANSSHFLRVKLEGGPEIDLVVMVADGDNSKQRGGYTSAISTGKWGAYGEGIPVLGKLFTDSVVLRWDETTQEFGFARRNSKADSDSALKPLGCNDFPTVSPAVETTPSVGVLVGSIIGGFLAGMLFVAAAVFFYWRGQRGVQSKYEAMRGEDAISLRTVITEGRVSDSRMSGPVSPPASSLGGSLRSQFGARSVSPMMEPYLVDDGQVYEAPEGGISDISGAHRSDTRTFSYDQR